MGSNNTQNLPRNPTIGYIDSYFYHHCKGHFISFTSTWFHLKMKSFLFTSSLVSSFLLAVCSNISKLQCSSTPMSVKKHFQFLLKDANGDDFNNMGYKGFLSYSSTIATLCFLPMNEDTRRRLFNLGSKIFKNMLWVSFSSNFLKKERKNSSTTQTSFLRLDAKEVNSSTIIGSTSIRLCKDAKILRTSLSF